MLLCIGAILLGILSIRMLTRSQPQLPKMSAVEENAYDLWAEPEQPMISLEPSLGAIDLSRLMEVLLRADAEEMATQEISDDIVSIQEEIKA